MDLHYKIRRDCHRPQTGLGDRLDRNMTGEDCVPDPDGDCCLVDCHVSDDKIPNGSTVHGYLNTIDGIYCIGLNLPSLQCECRRSHINQQQLMKHQS